MTDQSETEIRREDHYPIDLGQPLVLEVHNPNGEVIVRATERSDVLVSHVTHRLLGDFSDVDILTIDAHGNRIEVRANPHLGAGWGGFNAEVDLDAIVGQISKAFRWGGPWTGVKPGKVRLGPGGQLWCDITVEVPQSSSGRLEVHTASGDVRIEDVRSEITLQTASGDMRASRTNGDLRLRTASGDVTVEEARGSLSAQSASGDLRISAALIDGFQIQTASGDLLLDATLTGDRHCRAQTASGDVRLTLRRPTSGGAEPTATLALQTVSGDAHVSPPFRKSGRRLWQSGIDDSGPRIDVTTVSGDLSVGIAGLEGAFVPTANATPPAEDVLVAPLAPPVPVSAPEPPAPPSESAPSMVGWLDSERDFAANHVEAEDAPLTTQDPAVRLAVLEAVERGEIDVEEALRRLEAVDSPTGP